MSPSAGPVAQPIPPIPPIASQTAFGQPSLSPPQVPQIGQPIPGGYVATIDPLAKSKLVAGLLGIFLGWLGIHRFYLGYKNIAIAQLAVGLVGLLLSPLTCGLILAGAWIWGIVDGVMILTGSINTDGFGKPLRE